MFIENETDLPGFEPGLEAPEASAISKLHYRSQSLNKYRVKFNDILFTMYLLLNCYIEKYHINLRENDIRIYFQDSDLYKRIDYEIGEIFWI